MRCVSGIAAAAGLAAVLSVTSAPAWAGSDPAGRDVARLLLFAGTDLWRHGTFAYVGGVVSPGGLDREGLALKLMFGGGTYRYVSGALGQATVSGRESSVAVLPGWRIVHSGLYVTLFVGLDHQTHRLSPDDRSASLRGRNTGAQVAFEAWYEPSTIAMLAADGLVSTVGPSYSVRFAAGRRLFDRYYVGPELQGFAADDNYWQFRAGVHVTGLRTAEFEWRAGLGWALDNDRRNSAYGKLGVHARR